MGVVVGTSYPNLMKLNTETQYGPDGYASGSISTGIGFNRQASQTAGRQPPAALHEPSLPPPLSLARVSACQPAGLTGLCSQVANCMGARAAWGTLADPPP